MSMAFWHDSEINCRPIEFRLLFYKAKTYGAKRNRGNTEQIVYMLQKLQKNQKIIMVGPYGFFPIILNDFWLYMKSDTPTDYSV